MSAFSINREAYYIAKERYETLRRALLVLALAYEDANDVCLIGTIREVGTPDDMPKMSETLG